MRCVGYDLGDCMMGCCSECFNTQRTRVAVWNKCDRDYEDNWLSTPGNFSVLRSCVHVATVVRKSHVPVLTDAKPQRFKNNTEGLGETANAEIQMKCSPYEPVRSPKKRIKILMKKQILFFFFLTIAGFSTTTAKKKLHEGRKEKNMHVVTVKRSSVNFLVEAARKPAEV